MTKTEAIKKIIEKIKNGTVEIPKLEIGSWYWYKDSIPGFSGSGTVRDQEDLQRINTYLLDDSTKSFVYEKWYANFKFKIGQVRNENILWEVGKDFAEQSDSTVIFIANLP